MSMRWNGSRFVFVVFGFRASLISAWRGHMVGEVRNDTDHTRRTQGLPFPKDKGLAFLPLTLIQKTPSY